MSSLIRVRQHEVGLWFRHGDFRALLRPGAHWMPGRYFRGDHVELVDTLQNEFTHELLDLLLLDHEVREQLLVVELADHERALLWKDGRLARILGPGRHAFWKTRHELRAEIYKTDAVRFEHDKLDVVLSRLPTAAFFEVMRVAADHRGLVFVEGERLDSFGPGVYAFWKGAGRLTFAVVDLRERVADVAGQEIMTADKVTLRVNAVITHQVTDPQLAVSVVSDTEQALYRETQLALRAAVGGRPLERLLADKEAVGAEVRDAVALRAKAFGVAVRGVGIRDLVLPGDMKTILNQVILAQKQAEANVIRRREETAAARSQANTARLLADNPLLARMKELEALQDILAGTKATFVFGAGDVASQLRSLVRDAVQEEGEEK